MKLKRKNGGPPYLNEKGSECKFFMIRFELKFNILEKEAFFLNRE